MRLIKGCREWDRALAAARVGQRSRGTRVRRCCEAAALLVEGDGARCGRRRAAQGGAAWRGRRRGACASAGAWRGGEVEQERRACGSGGASREWRRRSGVRARVRAAVSREGRRTVSETDAWARGRIKRKTERAGPPTLSTGRSDGSKKKHRSNHRSKVDRI